MESITVKSISDLGQYEESVQTENKLFYVEDEQQYYCYSKDYGWIPTPVNVTPDGLVINLYELNKNLIKQLEPTGITDNMREKLEDWLSDGNQKTYMLYGKEVSYFTIMEYKEGAGESIVDLVISCLEEGFNNKVYACGPTDDNSAVEIWVQYQEQPTVLYLFDYTNGVAYYG